MSISPGPSLPGERRQGERTDQRADDLVGAIVRLMPDAAVVVDDDGTIVAANSLAEGLFGYPAGDLAGRTVDQLVPERYRPGHADHRSTYTSRPTQRPMGAGLELWANRRDGSEVPVDISLAPLGVPERPLTLAAVRDLTQRRTEWAALGRLAAVVSASDDAIISMDLKATVTSWNPGAQRLLGYRAEEMMGRPIFRLVPADRRGEMEEQLARVRSGLRMPALDRRRTRRNGEEIDVSDSLSLIREPSGEPIGFAWLMSDVTERKLAELELRRLLIETQRRERWLEAISDLRLKLLAGGELTESLDLIARRVCELVDADSSAVLLSAQQPGSMVVAASEGEAFSKPSADDFPAGKSVFGRVLESGDTWSAPDFATETELHPEEAEVHERVSARGATTEKESVDNLSTTLVGPVVVAPLATSRGAGGVLVVSRAEQRAAFANEEMRMVESFAQQAGLAVEIAQAESDREQLTLMADRERIARDLHDHVIQRLFAVGMALQAAAHSIKDSRALERINDSVEELDATIRDVRSTIFSLELRATERVETSARSQILDIASKAAAALGFQPRLQFDGPVDTRVSEDLIPDMLAVVRESLSNAARHAGASAVEVQVHVHTDLVVTVTDDGRGMHGVSRLSGLANMRTRAEKRGGTMTVSQKGDRGTRIEWRVPLP